MKPNVFKIGLRLGNEDALTAYWHYVLSVVPGLGQKFVDAVCESSGFTPSPFVGAVDHPPIDSLNRPDLLVQCRDWSLLFEHKVDSPIGPQQLHRYLDIAKARRWRLAVMAAGRVEVDEQVRLSPAFVSPTDPKRPSHFLWQDLFPILTSVNHHLAAEFAEYLEWIGFGKFTWAGIGDPFIDADAAQKLLSLYDALRPIYKGPGIQCRKRTGSLIYEIRRPLDRVHLINLGPCQSVAHEVPVLRGPVMELWVWTRRDGSHQERVLSTKDGNPGLSIPIVVKNHEQDTTGLSYDRNVHMERSYFVPLDYILRDSVKASEQRLTEFVQAAMGHLRQELIASATK